MIETIWHLDSMADVPHLIFLAVTLGEESSFCAFESPLQKVELLCAVVLIILSFIDVQLHDYNLTKICQQHSHTKKYFFFS